MSNEKGKEVAVTKKEPVSPAKLDAEARQFNMYLKLAEEFSKSKMFPNAQSAAAAFSIIQYGKELNIPPVTALQNIYIVNGRLGISTQLFAGKVYAAGVKARIVKETETEHEIEFIRGDEKYLSRFTIDDAKKMGLVKDGGSWTKTPKDMLHWRCFARGARRIAPDATLNLYTVEELEDLEPLEPTGKPETKRPEMIEVLPEASETIQQPETQSVPEPEQVKAEPKPLPITTAQIAWLKGEAKKSYGGDLAGMLYEYGIEGKPVEALTELEGKSLYEAMTKKDKK